MAVERGQDRGTWIWPVRRLAIYIRDRWCCVYCTVDLSAVESRFITLDHVVPESSGGTHDSSNLVTACLSCNSSRKDKTLRAWRPDPVARAAIQARVRNALRRSVPIEAARRMFLERLSAVRETASVDG